MPTQVVATPAVPRPFKSKTLAAGLALLFGTLGAHRFYLHGLGDKFGWAHLLGLLLGGLGYGLLAASGRASVLGWLLIVPGAASLLGAFLAAIVYGLRPDDKWDAQFNPASERTSESGWTAILIVIAALFVGALWLMSGLAVTFQTYFESQTTANSSSQ